MNFDNIVKSEQERKDQVKPPSEEEKEEIHKSGGMFEYQPRNIHTSQQDARDETEQMGETVQSFPRTRNMEEQHPADMDLETL